MRTKIVSVRNRSSTYCNCMCEYSAAIRIWIGKSLTGIGREGNELMEKCHCTHITSSTLTWPLFTSRWKAQMHTKQTLIKTNINFIFEQSIDQHRCAENVSPLENLPKHWCTIPFYWYLCTRSVCCTTELVPIQVVEFIRFSRATFARAHYY